MYRLFIVTALFAAIPASSSWAYRVLGGIEEAYEVELGEVGLPLSTNGTVHFKPCEECSMSSLRVDLRTRYFVQGVEYDFDDFLDAVAAIKAIPGGNRDTGVFLFYDPDTRSLNRLAVSH